MTMPSRSMLTWSTALSGLAIFSSLVQTTPGTKEVIFRRGATASANEWDPILVAEEGAKCADLAVIFARGTFDTPNLGVWVGGPFYDALHRNPDLNIAVQGVSETDYPADLPGYILQGGSDSCGEAMGRDIQKYHERCPEAAIAAWGWSQGSQCAHKAMGHLGDAADSLIALGAFGDPVSVWADTVPYPEKPANTEFLSYCNGAPTDPLCGHLRDDAPGDPVGFAAWLKDIWDEVSGVHMNEEQEEAFAELLVTLPGEAAKLAGQLARDIIGGHLQRWMLTPEHFWYGIDGTVDKAAQDLVEVYKRGL
ncbi:cutinase-domain-containing protein [Biscogniauxia marginata]|nr:cutinase-domain-containing protein [Biscogniauxia marginata]